MLFVAAKVMHLAFLPQGKVEATLRVKNMVTQMDLECPKIISHETIVRLNHEYLVATIVK